MIVEFDGGLFSLFERANGMGGKLGRGEPLGGADSRQERVPKFGPSHNLLFCRPHRRSHFIIVLQRKARAIAGVKLWNWLSLVLII